MKTNGVVCVLILVLNLFDVGEIGAANPIGNKMKHNKRNDPITDKPLVNNVLNSGQTTSAIPTSNNLFFGSTKQNRISEISTILPLSSLLFPKQNTMNSGIIKTSQTELGFKQNQEKRIKNHQSNKNTTVKTTTKYSNSTKTITSTTTKKTNTTLIMTSKTNISTKKSISTGLVNSTTKVLTKTTNAIATTPKKNTIQSQSTRKFANTTITIFAPQLRVYCETALIQQPYNLSRIPYECNH
jgi:hypothetical protein